MNSRETMSAEGLRCIAISEKATEAAIRKGVEIGVQAAIDYIEKQKQAAQKNRHDRMLHNTRLLLEKYKLLKKHTEDVIFSTNQLKENAIDILDSMDSFVVNDGIYIQTLMLNENGIRAAKVVTGHND